jgi:hypothetical protein
MNADDQQDIERPLDLEGSDEPGQGKKTPPHEHRDSGKSESGEFALKDADLEVDLSELPSDQRAWYVIHCYSGYENKVRHNLEQRIETMGMKDRIFDVVIPTQEEIEVKDGKRRTVERHVFPGYVLVNMILTEAESFFTSSPSH